MEPKNMMLLGDEGVAMGAIHSGISASYAYPGTPATEIQEAVQRYVKAFPDSCINAGWSINEKVAYEEALGCSFVGKRVLVNFKHVGLNVAADPFMSSMVTGVGGGMVIAVADDPGMHSSQNEQDSRFYAMFAQIPAFEPVNAQEAYNFTREAFELSEKFQLPVMVRLATRLSHTRANVAFESSKKQLPLKLPEDYNRWTVLPTNARPAYQRLLEKQPALVSWSENHPVNTLFINPPQPPFEKGGSEGGFGVIASGLGYNYFMECINPPQPPFPPHNRRTGAKGGRPADFHPLQKGGQGGFSYLRIATYPLPEKKITELLKNISKLTIIEEGYPLIERLIWKYIAATGKKIEVWGKLTGGIPLAGELNADIVRAGLGMPVQSHQTLDSGDLIRPRPPQLCKGCPHCDTFNALNKALEGEKEKAVFSDIGCYTLGFYPPFNAINSCVCMGASVSMAKAAGENGLKFAIGVIGDSTFNHSGITPLAEGIKRNAPFTTIILDNSITAMTGGQETLYIGEALEKLILGMGLPREHVRIIEALPKNLEANTKVIREECEYRGPSVVIARRECLQIK